MRGNNKPLKRKDSLDELLDLWKSSKSLSPMQKEKIRCSILEEKERFDILWWESFQKYMASVMACTHSITVSCMNYEKTANEYIMKSLFEQLYGDSSFQLYNFITAG